MQTPARSTFAFMKMAASGRYDAGNGIGAVIKVPADYVRQGWRPGTRSIHMVCRSRLAY